MLRYLNEYTKIPVPEIFYCDPSMLITEYIDHDDSGNVDEEAATLLASLHKCSASGFGFGESTTIGPFDQPNGWYDRWIDFFIERRLRLFSKAAYREGRISSSIYKRIEKLCLRCPKLLQEPERPALLHGDIWSGNVLCRNSKIAAFIDPAIYYGHREIELAFIAMFHTFGETFFATYHKLYPIAEGFFENRMALYQLYPYLVHVRAFGGSYLDGIERILNKYGL